MERIFDCSEGTVLIIDGVVSVHVLTNYANEVELAIDGPPEIIAPLREAEKTREQERVEEVLRFFEMLPYGDTRDALELVLVEGCSFNDAAERLGCTVVDLQAIFCCACGLLSSFVEIHGS